MRNLGRSLHLLASVGGIALVSVFAVLAPTAIAERGHHKPNLVVTRAEASGSKYTFDGVDASLSFNDVTKNKGDARARHSQTVLYAVPMFAGRHPNPREVASRSVPSLRPGHSDRGGASTTTDPDDYPPGAYKLVVCADAKNLVSESNEHNCVPTGRKFYVIEEDWAGDLQGKGGAGGIADLEHWHSENVNHLGFDKYLGDGVFRYEFRGKVEWKDDGTNINGCKWSGQGSLAVSEGTSGPGILLKYGNGYYKGTVQLDDEAFYPIFISGSFPCGGTADGPVFSDFLTIGQRKTLGFNEYNLEGRFKEPGAAEAGIWEWGFDATPP